MLKCKWITTSLVSTFEKNYSDQTTMEFIEMFTAGKLHKLDYKKLPIVPLDHRRIATLLKEKFPKRYTIDRPSDKNVTVNTFLARLYGLTDEEHQNLC